MNITTDSSSNLANNGLVEQILGFNNNMLIRDLFEIMNEVLANRDLSTYKHTLRVAQIAKAIGMLFRKHCDYMIYAEGDSEESAEELINQLRNKVSQTRNEWGIEANYYRVWFPRTTPIEEAMTRLFSLQVQDAESCKTTDL